jgi:hypothetical protein
MKFARRIFLFSLLMMSSCSEHVPTKNEQLFLDAADSLRIYQTAPYLQRELAGNQKARDLLEMDYDDFKKKHGWNDEEVQAFIEIMYGHISVAKLTDSYNLNDE